MNLGQSLPFRRSIRPLSIDPLPHLEKALNMSEGKIMCVGIGLQEYYCVCAIIGLVKRKQSVEDSKSEEQKAAYKVIQIIQKVLSLQDNYSAAATLASLPNMVRIFRAVVQLQREGVNFIAQPIAAPTGLIGDVNGNGNGIGTHGHMDGTDVLEVSIFSQGQSMEFTDSRDA